MKKILVIFIFLLISAVFVHAEDSSREEALEEFNSEVDGASTTTDTVPPLTREQLDDARIPMGGYYGWGDPFFGPEDEMDYELWRAHEDD